MPYELKTKHCRRSATRWLLHPGSSVSNVIGKEEASGISGVRHVRLFDQWFNGSRVGSYKDRIACVIAEGASASEAGDIADLGLSQLRIQHSKAPTGWMISGRKVASSVWHRAVNQFKQLSHSHPRLKWPLLSHSIIRDEAGFHALEPEWQNLFREARLQTPFLRHSWLRRCWEHQREFLENSLLAVVVRSNDRPVLIAPFVLRPHQSSWQLRLLDSSVPQQNDLLIKDSTEAVIWLDYLWRVITRSNVDSIELKNSAMTPC